jgi:GDP-4-dehydro-6-deoxy-D-mannose reductase
LSNVFKSFNPQFVFHLAAQANIPTAKANPRSTYTTNIIGSHNVVSLCQKLQINAHLASSSDVYGPSDNQIIEEFYRTNPNNPYGISKLAMENLAKSSNDARLPTVSKFFITRLFNCAGPGQYADAALSYFAKQCVAIKRGKQEPKITCHGNITSKRSWIDVRDVVRVYAQFPNVPRSQLNSYSHQDMIFNIAGPSFTLLELIQQLLERKALKDVKIEADYTSPALKQIGSSRKIRDKFNWHTSISIDQTLHDLLVYWEMK